MADPVAEQGFELLSSLRYDKQLGSCRSNNDPYPTPFYMLQRHYDRLVRAAKYFCWSTSRDAIGSIRTFEAALQNAVQCAIMDGKLAPLKVRYAVSMTGAVSVTCTSTDACRIETLYPSHFDVHFGEEMYCDIDPARSLAERTLPLWGVSISPDAIDPGPCTTFKTTSRAVYDSARQYMQSRRLPQHYSGVEVLIASREGLVLEGSVTSVYFHRAGKWYTPSSQESEGCWGGHTGTTRAWALDMGVVEEGRIDLRSIRDGELIVLSNGVRGFFYGAVVL